MSHTRTSPPAILSGTCGVYCYNLNMVRDRIDIRLMGSEFELIVVEKDQEASSLRLKAAIDEIRRIENLLTEFSDSSETATLNKNAGINAVQVEAEVYQLIQ